MAAADFFPMQKGNTSIMLPSGASLLSESDVRTLARWHAVAFFRSFFHLQPKGKLDELRCSSPTVVLAAENLDQT